MPFSGGTFSRLYVWVNERASPPIDITKLDTQEDDIAAGLSECVLRDGTGLPASVATELSGSFIGTLTGFGSGPTGTIQYRITGNLCTLFTTASITGTSNSALMSVTGLPSACITTTTFYGTCYGLQDSGSLGQIGIFSVAPAGTSVNFTKGPLDGSYTPFTVSGTKGLLAGWSVMYPLS